MSSLIDLQKRFSKTLITQSNEIEALLYDRCDTPTLASSVEIYSNAYRIRLLESLKKDYPMLNHLLGSESFDSMALKYIDKHPSASYSLRCFGQHLSSFLTIEPVLQKQPYLSELAGFEWQLADVFDLADSPVASVADMSLFAAEDWPQLTVKLHASVRRIILSWNLIDIYQGWRVDAKFTDAICSQPPQQCLIWRKELSPHYRLLDNRERNVLKVIEDHTFTEMCQTLSEFNGSEENAAFDAATYLKSWIAAGLIESVSIKQ